MSENIIEDENEQKPLVDPENIKNAMLEITRMRVAELTTTNITLEANVRAFANKIQLLLSGIEESKEETKKFVNMEAFLDQANIDIKDLNNKIETGYKPKIKELEGKLEKITLEFQEQKNTISIGSEKSGNKITKLEVENESLRSDYNDLTSKVETGYKPRIKELEQKLKDLDKGT